MTHQFRLCSVALLLVTVLGTGTGFADEFESLFDGETLKGWQAKEMSYWSVRDGAITAQSK